MIRKSTNLMVVNALKLCCPFNKHIAIHKGILNDFYKIHRIENRNQYYVILF
jgi:hypothetical protein